MIDRLYLTLLHLLNSYVHNFFTHLFVSFILIYLFIYSFLLRMVCYDVLSYVLCLFPFEQGVGLVDDGAPPPGMVVLLGVVGVEVNRSHRRGSKRVHSHRYTLTHIYILTNEPFGSVSVEKVMIRIRVKARVNLGLK